MQITNFLNHRRYLWMWVNLGLLVALTVIYVLHDPIGGPSGSTWLGLTYGVIAAVGMMVLIWLGVRKRTFANSTITLKGWVAFHVWLGLVVLLIVPLHSGFSFGTNIHTLSYFLIVLTVVTGIWGAIAYITKAGSIKSNRGGSKPIELLQQIELADTTMRQTALEKSDAFNIFYNQIDFTYRPGIRRAVFGKVSFRIDPMQIAAQLKHLPASETDAAMSLVSTLNQKIEYCSQLDSEIRTDFWLKVWLYLHVPLACAAVIAMFVHIFAVFYFR